MSYTQEWLVELVVFSLNPKSQHLATYTAQPNSHNLSDSVQHTEVTQLMQQKSTHLNCWSVSDIQVLVCFSSLVALVLFLVSKDDSGVGHLSLVRCQEGAGWTRLRPQFSDVKLFNGGEAKVQGKS